MICSIIKKQLPFEVLQNAVREKPAKLEELTLLKVRLWLVLEYFRNGNFREFLYWAGGFPTFWTGIRGGPVCHDGNKNAAATAKTSPPSTRSTSLALEKSSWSERKMSHVKLHKLTLTYGENDGLRCKMETLQTKLQG